MPSLNFNQITKAYRGTQQLDAIYHGDKQIFPISNPDPYSNNVILYLKGDGANNSSTIIDSSPTPKTITRFGDAVISTAQSKYGGSSIFQGTNGYLSTNLGTYGQGNFTIEFWCYITSYPSYSFVLGNFNTGNWHVGFDSISPPAGNKLNLHINSHIYFPLAVPPLNSWTHVALSRESGVVRAFLNGTLSGSQNLATALWGNSIQIFKRPFDNLFLKGYLDSLRFTDGVARYTANFNPETDTYLAY